MTRKGALVKINGKELAKEANDTPAPTPPNPGSIDHNRSFSVHS
jgi:hypothetical protein